VDTIVITVTAPIAVNNIDIVQGNQSLAKGSTLQLTTTLDPSDATNKNVTWSSSDETVATVSTTGLVSALKGGVATITVTTTDGGKTDTVVLTVIASVDGVTIDQDDLSLVVGDTLQLTTTFDPLDATNKAVQWTSDTTAVATVDSNGIITAESVGYATITATTTDGNKTDTIEVHVTQGYIRATLIPTSLGGEALMYDLASGPHASGGFEGYVLPTTYEIPISVVIPTDGTYPGSPAMTMYYGSSEPAKVISTDGDFGSYASSSVPFTYSYCMFPQLSEITIGTPITEYMFGTVTKDTGGVLTQRIESTGNSLSVVLTDKGDTSGYVAGTINGTVYDNTAIDIDNGGNTADGVPYMLMLSFKVPLFLFPSP
ncbi:MAG: Ig-like domain-containing protein, partial [Sphaerochaeta associata]|uniref:Ig-like domain-containing protein n=1 Tax=Sphaerochaeta associata TaxID=1129264 RepID=UPI002B1F0F15